MKKILLLALWPLLAAGPACAHSGHDLVGFSAGFMHPLTGWDHLLVMFALGIWAARRPAAQGWQLPVLFVAVMALSASLAMMWPPVLLAETLVAASVLVMGVLLVSPLAFNRSVQVAVVSLAAAVHGYVHGVDIGSELAVLVGMVLATAILHVSGWWLGRQTHPGLQSLAQWIGRVMVCLGAVWVFA